MKDDEFDRLLKRRIKENEDTLRVMKFSLVFFYLGLVSGYFLCVLVG